MGITKGSKSPKPKKGSQSPPLTKTSTKLVSTKGTTEPPGALRAGLVDGGKRRLTRQGADLPQMALVVHSCAHAKLAHTQNCHNEKRKNEGGHRWMPVPARAARRAVGARSEPAVPAASAPRNLAWVPSEPWPGFHTAAISPPFGLRWPESWPSSFKFRVLQVKSQEITPKVNSTVSDHICSLGSPNKSIYLYGISSLHHLWGRPGALRFKCMPA